LFICLFIIKTRINLKRKKRRKENKKDREREKHSREKYDKEHSAGHVTRAALFGAAVTNAEVVGVVAAATAANRENRQHHNSRSC
jgi:hypothetical protein